MDIRLEFGQRCRELRARSGMSQEMLAYRSGLDRSYIASLELGHRNISLVNIEKITAALTVSMEYLFSNERFSAAPTYHQKDFTEPFLERFKYHLDPETQVLAFSVKGLLSPKDVEYMDRTLMRIYEGFEKGEVSLLVDHRDMLASDGQPVVYSPDVAEKVVEFQRRLLKYSKKVAVLCNSKFMVNNLCHIAAISGINKQSSPLFGKDRQMIQEAYEILGICGNDLIKEKKQ